MDLDQSFINCAFFSGFFLLYCFRRMINEYYNWSIQRKIHAREEVTKKKRELLEKVKETETFKVSFCCIKQTFFSITVF